MKTSRLLYIGLGIAIVAAVAVLASLLPPKTTQTNDKLSIVAAENFWGNIAAQIAGDRANVTSLMSDPSFDPHLYESSIEDASNVTTADIVIMNGASYDDFMSDLLAAPSAKTPIVITVAGLLDVQEGANPHVWYDIPRIGQVAKEIQRVLSETDPTYTALYSKNLDTFLSSMQPLQQTIEKIKLTHPQAPIAYTERVADYLIANAGLTDKTPGGFAAAIEEAIEPSPAEYLAFETVITQKHIKVLLYNAQATSPATEKIKRMAEQHGIPVVGVTETMPENAKDYQSWQQSQLDALLKALDNTR